MTEKYETKIALYVCMNDIYVFIYKCVCGGVCEYAYIYVCMFVNVRLYDAMYRSIVVLREKGDPYLDLLIISPSRAGAIEPRPTKVTGNNADRYPKMNPS